MTITGTFLADLVWLKSELTALLLGHTDVVVILQEPLFTLAPRLAVSGAQLLVSPGPGLAGREAVVVAVSRLLVGSTGRR